MLPKVTLIVTLGNTVTLLHPSLFVHFITFSYKSMTYKVGMACALYIVCVTGDEKRLVTIGYIL